jgi:hypothetical protein
MLGMKQENFIAKQKGMLCLNIHFYFATRLIYDIKAFGWDKWM